MFQRSVLQLLKDRMNEPKKFIQVLVGSRQVGKTTIIKQFLADFAGIFHFVTADDISNPDNAWLRTEWERARIMLQNSDKQEIVLIIDEVQKIPNWSETVKREWDWDYMHDRNVKVILSGSSRLLLQQGLTESLAGRFELIFVPHWSFSEMNAAFGWNVEQYIYFGGYPGAAGFIGDENRWKDYIRNSLVETTLSKDILMMTRVDKPVLLRRLFDIACKYSSQILSLSKIQGELNEKGNLTTLSGYINLLNEAGLLSGLEKYSADIVHKRASKPKFQVHNNALLAVNHSFSFEQVKNNPDEWGRFFESTVGTHLVNNSYSKHYKVYYWNQSNSEVDFVLERGEKVVAIEVKSGKKSMNRGLHLFLNEYPAARPLLVGTDGIALEEFLKINPVELF